jgi:hypothetical protein
MTVTETALAERFVTRFPLPAKLKAEAHAMADCTDTG